MCLFLVGTLRIGELSLYIINLLFYLFMQHKIRRKALHTLQSGSVLKDHWWVIGSLGAILAPTKNKMNKKDAKIKKQNNMSWIKIKIYHQ